jgi:hypothetical protein
MPGVEAVFDVKLGDLAVKVTVVGIDPLLQVADGDDVHALKAPER